MKRSRSLPSAAVTALVTLLLCLQWWLGVSATFEQCATSDELAHVAGGLSYWQHHDYRLQPENGNLPQRLAALPWLAADAHMEVVQPLEWERSNVWLLGHRLFYASGNNTDFLLALSRAVMGLTGTGVGLLIFFWSRKLWGDVGGLISLGLFAFCPNFLANSPLATSDVTMSLALLAAVTAYWWHTRNLSWKSGVLSVAVVSLTCVAKFSFVLLLPICGLLVLFRLFSREPLTVAFRGQHTLTTLQGKLVVLVGSAIVHTVAAWLLIWLCFDGRYSAVGPGMPDQSQFFAPWELVMPPTGFWHLFFDVARRWHALPEPFLQGFAYVLYAAAERGAFLNGQYSNSGWVLFFPYAFIVKTPWSYLVIFLSTGLASAIALLRSNVDKPIQAVVRCFYPIAPLAVLFLIYWAFSLTSHLNIGLRHILPTYPVLFIIAGSLGRITAPLWMPWLAATLVLLGAFEVNLIRPHYLAFFNGFAGGPENGWRHLVDSSLDWGQDLPSLERWLKKSRLPEEKTYVSYFGTGDLSYEGIKAEEFAPVYNFDRPRRWFELEPGLYCISATMLQDVYSGWRGAWSLEKERSYLALQNVFKNLPRGQPVKDAEHGRQRYELDRLRFSRLSQYLRLRKPEAVVGFSIFVFRLNAQELQIAVHGSLTELADLMEKTVADSEKK